MQWDLPTLMLRRQRNNAPAKLDRSISCQVLAIQHCVSGQNNVQKGDPEEDKVQ